MNKNPMNSFENKVIRTLWNEEDEEWYFSIVDVVGALTEQETQRSASTYWAVLKKRIVEESKNELLTNCKQLKMRSHSVISEKNATELHPTEINSIVIDLIEETSKLSTKTKDET